MCSIIVFLSSLPRSVCRQRFFLTIGAWLLALSSLYAGTALGSEAFDTQSRYLYIQPGQSLYNIVKVIYPNHQKQWPAIMKMIVRKNPHAFVGADASRIRAGERLVLPHTSSIQPVSAAGVYHGSRAVGKVVKQRGKTFVITPEKKRRELQKGGEVFVGDRIYTGVKGFVRLSMIDEAKIDIRCNSEMLIEDYQLKAGSNRSVIYLIKGSVKKISGSIGKMAEDIYEMKTPLATVGVRGTEYAIRVLQSHGCDGSLDVNSRGMFVKVNQGAIDLKTLHQKQRIKKGDAAYLANKGAQLKDIDTREGLFGNENNKTLFGSSSWLLLILPLIWGLRKYYVATR